MQECIIFWKENKKQDTAFIKDKICKYYETIPSTLHSYQRLFVSRDIASTFSHANQTHHTRHTSTSFVGLIDITTILKNAVSQSNAIEQINLTIKSIFEH